MELGRFELSLNVADISESKAFYEKLGFHVVAGDQQGGFLVLTNGGTVIGLYQGHLPANLMSFRGRDAAALQAELDAAGLERHEPAAGTLGGTRGTWLKDPDGNLIYFNTRPSTSE